MTRGDLTFLPGQSLMLGPCDQTDVREYSIYSKVDAPFLEVLVREVAGGKVSMAMRRLRENDKVNLEGPVGHFTIPHPVDPHTLHVFVATGTGISPFHSMVTSHPELNYQIFHGVRDRSDSFDADDYIPSRYTLCTSRDRSGGYAGRVTDCLKSHALPDAGLYFLCGNGRMLDDVFDVLTARGVEPDRIRTELYF